MVAPSPPSQRTALLAGATGLVGSLCLDELLASGAYDGVIVVSRRSLDRKHPKLRVVVTDFERLDHVGQELRADDVFCCLGTTMARAGTRERFRKVDYEYPVRLARVARQQGAERFILVSSLGADPGAQTFYARVKGETEAAVAREGFATLVILRPSLLLGGREERRPLERVAQRVFRRLVPVLVGPLRRARPIEATVVARAMVRLAASSPDGRHIVESHRIAEEGR